MSKYHGQLYACISKKGVVWLKSDPVLTNNRNKTRQLSPNPPGPLPTLFFPFLDNKSPGEKQGGRTDLNNWWRTEEDHPRDGPQLTKCPTPFDHTSIELFHVFPHPAALHTPAT